MRTFTAILSFSIFIVCQYAKCMSYVECRIVGFFIPAEERCDCEKLIENSNGPGNPIPPLQHKHLRFDDTGISIGKNAEINNYFTDISCYTYNADENICKGIVAGLYRPPRYC